MSGILQALLATNVVSGPTEPAEALAPTASSTGTGTTAVIPAFSEEYVRVFLANSVRSTSNLTLTASAGWTKLYDLYANSSDTDNNLGVWYKDFPEGLSSNESVTLSHSGVWGFVLVKNFRKMVYTEAATAAGIHDVSASIPSPDSSVPRDGSVAFIGFASGSVPSAMASYDLWYASVSGLGYLITVGSYKDHGVQRASRNFIAAAPATTIQWDAVNEVWRDYYIGNTTFGVSISTGEFFSTPIAGCGVLIGVT